MSVSKGNCADIKQIFHNSYYKLQPKSLYNKRLFNIDISGNNYLLNPDELLKNSSDWEFASYLYLASFRNYTDYKLFGVAYLDLGLVPDVSIDKYKANKLLTITTDKIKFKYEE